MFPRVHLLLMAAVIGIVSSHPMIELSAGNLTESLREIFNTISRDYPNTEVSIELEPVDEPPTCPPAIDSSKAKLLLLLSQATYLAGSLNATFLPGELKILAPDSNPDPKGHIPKMSILLERLLTGATHYINGSGVDAFKRSVNFTRNKIEEIRQINETLPVALPTTTGATTTTKASTPSATTKATKAPTKRPPTPTTKSISPTSKTATTRHPTTATKHTSKASTSHHTTTEEATTETVKVRKARALEVTTSTPFGDSPKNGTKGHHKARVDAFNRALGKLKTVLKELAEGS